MNLSLPSPAHTKRRQPSGRCLLQGGWLGINPGNLRVLHNSYFLRALMKGTLFAYLPGGFELVFHSVLLENFVICDHFCQA